ncbi:MAG TPA: dienelactone hydrolase family protein [Bradyrhizobium sp.]|nr:dienelactone hydrolase family protein [Bradyrhizobium sp.]
MIMLTAADGHMFSAYRADPPDAPKGAVVVIQEVFGVNSHIRQIADAFAATGYIAIAPSLFDSLKTGVELGYDDAGVAEGIALVHQVDKQRALAEIQAAVDSVRSVGKVAVVGYSWGGYLAYAAGNLVTGLACAVGYYGGGIVDDYGAKRKVPTLLHFGENDPLIPLEAMSQFRAFRPDVSVFSYPGASHGFNCDQRDSYQEEAAQTALKRTLFWISQYVQGQAPIALKNSGAYAQAKVDKKKKKAAADDLGPPAD